MAVHIAIPGQADFTAGAAWNTGTAFASWAAGDIAVFPPGYSFNYTTMPGAAPSNALGAIEATDCSISFSSPLLANVNNAGGRGVLLRNLRGGTFQLNGATNAVVAIGPGTELVISGGAQGPIMASKGSRVNVGAAATLGDVNAEDGSYVEVGSHASDRIATARVNSGAVLLARRSLEAGIINAARLRLVGAAGITDGSSGGVVDLNAGAILQLALTSAPTLKNVRVWNGLVDPGESTVSLTLDNDTTTEFGRIIEEYARGSLTRSSSTKYGLVGRSGGVYDVPVVP
jgi:hypothetical protein